MENIFEITKVETEIQKSNPPRLVIKAEGKASSSNWTGGKLEARIYPDFPADGIQDFDFVATPPTTFSNPVLTDISAMEIWEDPPANVKGVRVHSKTNFIEA